MGVYIWNNLPSGYQEVEYIQSSGTQYIDTGISANQYLSFEVDFAALGSTQDTNLFGARTGGESNRFGLTIYSNLFHFMVGNTGTWNVTIDTDRHQASVFLNNGNFTSEFDGITDSGSVGTSVYVNKNFYLFKIDYNSQSGCPMKLYSFKLYIGNSDLVRDFVPCYRKSDNVIGMYDLVNDQFYTNSGTGTFTKGSDVNTYRESSLKNAYIGEYVWTRPSNLKGGYWRLDGNMNDSSGNGHNGSGTSNYTTDRNGTANGAYDASSSSYYVSIPNSPELYMTNGEKFSIGFWIQPHYSSGAGYTYGVISMTQNVDSYPGWSIHNDSITKTWQFRARTNGQPMGFSLSALSFNVNERFHFVITYDGTNIKYYKNATLLGSEPYTSGDCSTTYPLTIGYASTWYASGNAAYDDVFYMKDYCLSGNEIKNIYDNGIS